jgi:hypothetical protein
VAALGEWREREAAARGRRRRERGKDKGLSTILFLIAMVTWPLVFIVLGGLAPKQSQEILIGFGFSFPNNSNSIP